MQNALMILYYAMAVRLGHLMRYPSILMLTDKRTVPRIKLKMCPKNRGAAVIRQ